MDSDRDMLIRIEQKLQDSISNYKQMVLDIKEVFGKIESDSKSIVQIETNLKTFVNDQSDVESDLSNLEKKISNISKEIEEENKKRIAFESDIKGSQRAYKVIVSIIASLAALVSILSFLYNIAAK